MNKQNLYFQLFSTCIPVKGASAGLIYDLNRGEIHPTSNLIFDVLQNAKGKTINELKAFYNNKYNDGIDAFFDSFAEKELGFYTDEPDSFPELNLDWHDPHFVTNAILEIALPTNVNGNDTQYYNVFKALEQLDKLGCSAIQFRFLGIDNSEMAVSIEFVQQILSALDRSRIELIECFLPYSTMYPIDDKVLTKITKNPRLATLFLYSNDTQNTLNPTYLNHLGNDKLYPVSQRIVAGMKDEIYFDNFALNVSIFTEAQQYNIGLNRKVCIDYEGNVKNYVSHQKSFGHIDSIDLTELIASEAFKEKWLVSNDKVQQCKDCQYRYVCLSNTDLEFKDGEWHKTDYCNFNPNLNEWAEATKESKKNNIPI